MTTNVLKSAISKYLAYRKEKSREALLSDDYKQEQEELRENLLLFNEEIIKHEEQTENIDRFIDKVWKYLDLD